MALSIPRIGSNVLNQIAEKATDKAIDVALHLVAKAPGDPVTQMLASKLPGSTVTRTSDSSWKITDRAGTSYTASVSGNQVTMTGPWGTKSQAAFTLPQLPSLPSLPSLPKVQIGKIANAIANSVIGASLQIGGKLGSGIITDVVQKQYPGAVVRSDGPSSWTVSKLGNEKPFQVKIQGNSVVATRDGQELARKTVTAGDFAAAFRSVFAKV